MDPGDTLLNLLCWVEGGVGVLERARAVIFECPGTLFWDSPLIIWICYLPENRFINFRWVILQQFSALIGDAVVTALWSFQRVDAIKVGGCPANPALVC